jgi:hypothetical protein
MGFDKVNMIFGRAGERGYAIKTPGARHRNDLLCEKICLDERV